MRRYNNILPILFNEELGAVIQVAHQDTDTVLSCLREYGLAHHSHVIGTINDTNKIEFYFNQALIFSESLFKLQETWSETSYQMQKLRDNPICAEQEFLNLSNRHDPGLSAIVPFELHPIQTSASLTNKPQVAILREQGVNGHIEMAAAFHRAGFACHDVHMSDIISGRIKLEQFSGLVACGGFSYGDVLGAGSGWANTILFNARARNEFEQFFKDPTKFALGVCNGCQMLSQLKSLIPGADHWPQFLQNYSEQFEARLSRVEILPSPSIFFTDMTGAMLPIVVSHGEGRAYWENMSTLENAMDKQLVTMRYVDNLGLPAETYPANPNGSPEGITGLTNTDGRITLLMPHPERVFKRFQFSWSPETWAEDSPWLRMFQNASAWVKAYS
ncbi:MAG: phosphoribosylformylglycinamidine synthase subunit PurQ [Gammaproteobacteria bacterium]